MTPQEIKLLSPLNLAYIGDGIYELMTRMHMMNEGNVPVNKLHKKTIALVCASAQSKAYETIADVLTEEETAVFKRGRNANGTHVPKNADAQEYRRATGVEALFGYLYMMGRMERAESLYEMIYQSFRGDVFGEN